MICEIFVLGNKSFRVIGLWKYVKNSNDDIAKAYASKM